MTLQASKFGPPSSDRELAALAAAQYGVVSREQIRALGLNDTAISQRCRAGRLHRVHFGVYAVGHSVLAQPGRWMAAVLACGPGAALSHASAAALWDLRRGDARVVDVVAKRTGRKRRGIRVHRPRRLPDTERTTRRGIPLTTPARTILDLAATLSPSRLEHLLDQAEIQALTDYSWRYHKTRSAFEDDRARDVLTTTAGYRTLRFTDRQLERHPQTVAAAIASVLADRRAA